MGKLEKQVMSQIDKDLTRAYNEFIRFMVTELSTEVERGGVSPAYTGFFASSWKASTSRVTPVDQVEKFEPWSQIKKEKRSRFPEMPPYIDPRFDLPRFGIKDTVYIGNTTKYARWALQRPNQIVPFVARAKSVAKVFFGPTGPGSIKVMATGTSKGTYYKGVL